MAGMAFDEDLANRIRELLASESSVTCSPCSLSALDILLGVDTSRSRRSQG